MVGKYIEDEWANRCKDLEIPKDTSLIAFEFMKHLQSKTNCKNFRPIDRICVQPRRRQCNLRYGNRFQNCVENQWIV